MSEYESESFEHLLDDLMDKKNPRKELDDRFGNNETSKIQAINSVLRKLKLEKEDLDNTDPIKLDDNQIERAAFIDEEITIFETMKAELEPEKIPETDSSFHDLSDKEIG